MENCLDGIIIKLRPNAMLKDAQDWMDKNPKDSGQWEVFLEPPGWRCEEGKEVLVRVVRELESKQNMASAILELSGFSPSDSTKAVQNLIDDLRFYSQDHWPFVDDDTKRYLYYWPSIRIGPRDIPFIGRLIGPRVRCCNMVTFYEPEAKTLYFCLYLCEILYACGARVERYCATTSDLDINKAFGFVGEEFRAETPVIVFESSDVCAAVNSVLQSVWKFNGETYWTPSHVYVQESIFDTFVHLLKMDAVNHEKVHCFSACRTVDQSNVGAREGASRKGHPPVFQPCRCSHFKFFLGWDPKVLQVEEKVGRGVVVLPFRTADEGIKAANSLPNAFCASIWTEKSEFGSRMASLLKMSTVWINCHGILEHHTSFAGDSEFVPLNGPDLMEFVLNYWTPKNSMEIKTVPQSENSSLKEFTATDTEEVLKKVKSPSELAVHERITLLRPLKKLISSIVPSLEWVWPSEFVHRKTDSGTEVITQFLPAPLLNVYIRGSTDEKTVIALLLAFRSILSGSPVVFNIFASTEVNPFERLAPIIPLFQKGFIVLKVADFPEVVRDELSYFHVISSRDGRRYRFYRSLNLLPHFPHSFTPSKNVFLS